MNKLRALCEKWREQAANIRNGGLGREPKPYSERAQCKSDCAEQLSAILPDMERLEKELFDSHGITCNVRGHAVGAGQGCNCSPAISKVEFANLKANVERLVEAAQKYLNCPHLNTLGYFGHCGECRLILAQALAPDQPVVPKETE